MAFRQSVIKSILIAQVLVTCILAISLVWLDKQIALSALIGGMICVVPNAYLARKLTSKRTADVNQLKNNLYAAEFGKILITFALFAAVFATQEWIHPVALLAGFGLAQLTHWFTPVVLSVINKNRD